MFQDEYRKVNDSVRAPESILVSVQQKVRQEEAKTQVLRPFRWPRVIGYSSAAVAVATLALVVSLSGIGRKGVSSSTTGAAPQAAEAKLTYSNDAVSSEESAFDAVSEDTEMPMLAAAAPEPAKAALDSKNARPEAFGATAWVLEADGVTYRLDGIRLIAERADSSWVTDLSPVPGLSDPIPERIFSADGHLCVIASAWDVAGTSFLCVYGFTVRDDALVSLPAVSFDGYLEDAESDGRTIRITSVGKPRLSQAEDSGNASTDEALFRSVEEISFSADSLLLQTLSSVPVE